MRPEPSASSGAERWEKLPCSCLGETDKDGYTWIVAEGFLCEARHKQGDLVEVLEGLARRRMRREDEP